MYNIITLKYNIQKYREVRKEERARARGWFHLQVYMDCKKY